MNSLKMNLILDFQTREELQQTREDLQKTKEKLINEGDTYRKKILDLESEHSSLKKANSELEVRSHVLSQFWCFCQGCANNIWMVVLRVPWANLSLKVLLFEDGLAITQG